MFFVAKGQTIEVACPSILTTDPTTNLTMGDSVTGYRRASYFGGLTTLRSWGVDTSATSGEELAMLEAIATGGLGTDDLGFIPCGAEHLNLLPPGASLLATVSGATRRPATVAADGKTYPSGVTVSSTALIASRVPWAFPGQQFTISMVSNDVAAFSIRWLKANGELINYQGVNVNTDGFTRSQATHFAPAEAAYFDAHINGSVTAPAITLGANLRPWSVGKAAKSVVVEPGGTQLLAAWNPANILSSSSFTVREVGAYV